MRRIAFVLLVAACSSKSPKPPPPPVVTADVAATTAPPVDAGITKPDAAVATQTSKPAPTPEACPLKPLPKGCPVEEPPVNRPCDKKGVQCIYVAGCCPSPVYVCNKKGRFEARFQRCG